mmetsp:Transcript_3134/g.3716  ORF Transcript_3134/g.3716 Transcript_3134/m.3716 type:complete len:376 (+) Transcript_3134:837-1964(+)
MSAGCFIKKIRVINAIEVNTNRSQNDIRAYEEKVIHEEKTTTPNNDDSNQPSVISAYSQEIDELTKAYTYYSEELKNINKLIANQNSRSRELANEEKDCLREANFVDFSYYKVYRDQNDELVSDFIVAQKEDVAASSIRLFSLLFTISLPISNSNIGDGSVCREYHMINGLRLALRPSKCIDWGEINAAWSQAAQLLMLVCASVSFSPSKLRIIPLTSGCAKVMQVTESHAKVVHNLGKDFAIATSETKRTFDGGKNDDDNKSDASLMLEAFGAFSEILLQLIDHVTLTFLKTSSYNSKFSSIAQHQQDEQKPPFPMSDKVFGSHNSNVSSLITTILSLSSNDSDKECRYVVNATVTNLKWISNIVDQFILHDEE